MGNFSIFMKVFSQRCCKTSHIKNCTRSYTMGCIKNCQDQNSYLLCATLQATCLSYCHIIKNNTVEPLKSEPLKFVSPRMSHYACCPPLLWPGNCIALHKIGGARCPAKWMYCIILYTVVIASGECKRWNDVRNGARFEV